MFRKNFTKINTGKADQTFSTYLIWCTAALFTIFQLFLEMSLNTMTDSLMSSFNVNPVQIGFLSSTFFYTFLLMQFPAGIILDKFNIKWVLSISCAGCGIGCLLFSHSSSFGLAVFSRFIMGGFAAFGFLGLLKISTVWFPQKIFPFLVGFSQFLVMLATAIGEPIVMDGLNHHNWRAVLSNAGYIAFIIATLITLLVKHRENEYQGITLNELFKNTKSLLRNKQCWLYNFFGFGMFSAIGAFSALWGIAYLIDVYHLNNLEAATAISINFVGVGLGCAMFGILGSYLSNYLIILRFTSLGAFIILLILTCTSTLSTSQVNASLFLLGIFCGAFFLCFDLIKKCVPTYTESIATAFCNIFVMSSTILLQPLIGFLIDLLGNFRISIFPLLCVYFISFIISFFIETNESIVSNDSLIFPPHIN